MMVRLSAILASLAVLGSKASAERLDVIDLPLGFMPEGITLGEGWTAYVGHRLDGSVWMGDLSTGEGEVVVPATGTVANGLEYDRRSGYLYVCGGPTGTVRIYDTSFDLVADVALAGVNATSFVNDVIITRRAAYITDSFSRNLYKIPLNKDDGLFASEEIFETIVLSDNFVWEDGSWYANGIVETDDGMLIIANNEAGELYLVDPSTGDATLIDIGGVVINGDGLVLRKNTLWVVDIQTSSVNEVLLSADMTCGSVAARVLTNDLLDYPTTAARKGNSLYVVSAKFETATEDIPTTPYEIVRLDRDSGEYACTA